MELWGQPYTTAADVDAILKDKAWSVAHWIAPETADAHWPKIYNVLREALELGAEQGAVVLALLDDAPFVQRARVHVTR